MEILVTVDSRKCIASQTCISLAEGMFKIGTAGYSSPTRDSWNKDDLPRLREAEMSCPSGAIRVEVEE